MSNVRKNTSELQMIQIVQIMSKEGNFPYRENETHWVLNYMRLNDSLDAFITIPLTWSSQFAETYVIQFNDKNSVKASINVQY